jgi:hypothetical protein
LFARTELCAHAVCSVYVVCAILLHLIINMHIYAAPAAVPSLQQCNTSASPYIGEIGVKGTIYTQFLI